MERDSLQLLSGIIKILARKFVDKARKLRKHLPEITFLAG